MPALALRQLMLLLALGLTTASAVAQSNPTPGAPSIPLTPTALANGVANRITYQYGTEFVTIGATNGGAGNARWAGNGTAGDRAVGRGSVNYEYRLGRFEVNTSQWVAFYNAAFDRAADDRLPWLTPPTFWGAAPTAPTHPEGQRWSVPAGNEMRAVGNISWRTAAMYANWLHNDQSTDRAAFLNGAYNVSTFGDGPFAFTDQLTHNASARFWIPTLDEAIKGSHFDPSRAVGDAQGQWWTWNNGTDQTLAYGPPGVNVHRGFPTGPDPLGPLAEANGGWDDLDFPGHNPFLIKLGAYGATQSPWGLLDVAGGTTEWLEEVGLVNGVFPRFRFFDGSPWNRSGATQISDTLSSFGGDAPTRDSFDLGLRIAAAAAVPSPGFVLLVPVMLVCCARRGKRGGDHPTRTPARGVQNII